MSKSWPLFPYQKHSFNEEIFTGSEVMIDCNISLVNEMANENRWQTYMYQHGKKELTNVNVTKEMNSDSFNVSFINAVWIPMYSLYVHMENNSKKKTIMTESLFLFPFHMNKKITMLLEGRRECVFIHLDIWNRDLDKNLAYDNLPILQS